MVCGRTISVMVMSVAQAADELGVGRTRVRALIAQGMLPAEKVSGAFVLDEGDVDALAGRERLAHVRAFSARVAWACAALADGHRPEWVRADELSRLRARLTRAGQHPGAWQMRLSRLPAHSDSYRCGPEQARSLLTDKRTVRTGQSATNLVGDKLVGPSGADVWVAGEAELAVVSEEFGLLRSSGGGNVTIRVPGASGLPVLGVGDGNAFRLVVAADLLAAPDPRVRRAGHELLAATLGEHRWVR
jgi:excisionase family DNA binding protein